MTDRELYGLMLKWGKLKGTIEQPLFSDRHFIRELKKIKREKK